MSDAHLKVTFRLYDQYKSRFMYVMYLHFILVSHGMD